MALSDDVKSAVSLREMVEGLAEVDRGKSAPIRGEWFFSCPLHGEKTASFRVFEKPGEIPGFFCFGCNARGTVIDLVMNLDGVPFAEAVERLAREYGVGRAAPDAETRAAREAEAERRRHRAAQDQKRRDAQAIRDALAIWREAKHVGDIDGAILCEYLENRIGRFPGVPATLRIGRLACYMTDDDGRAQSVHVGPCMVAAVGRAETGLKGVHRTWITPQGRARLTGGAKVPKQMRGPTFGHPVRLTPYDPAAPLIVGEGIETTLAYLDAWQRVDRGPVAAEAALSLGSLCGAEAEGRDADNPCPVSGRPIPSTAPDPTRPGWLPPEGHRGPVILLADPSEKSPASAEAHITRGIAKLTGRGFDASAEVPRGRFDHDDDFADLAQKGELML